MLEVNIGFPFQGSFVQGDMGDNRMERGPSGGWEMNPETNRLQSGPKTLLYLLENLTRAYPGSASSSATRGRSKRPPVYSSYGVEQWPI